MLLYLHTNLISCYRYLLTPFLCLILCLSFAGCDQSSDKKMVSIVQIIEHPALEDVRRGIEDTLKRSKLYRDGKLSWRYANAQGSITTAVQIANKIIGHPPNVAVAIGTSVAQTLYSALKEHGIPIVFTAVTDPVAAGLMQSLQAPHPNITGVMDAPRLDKQLDLMQTILPDMKTIGVMYNPGESNSVATLEKFKALAQLRGFKIIEGPVYKTVDVLQVANSIMPKVDAIFSPQDNIVVAAMRTVVNNGIRLGTPVFAADSGSVKNGAVATLSYSYYELGQETGQRILEILDGKPPGSIPVTTPSGVNLYLNQTTAKALNIVLPNSLLQKAYEVY